MNFVSSWIISICGIIIVSLLAEIVLPNGKTNKLIKSILALFSVVTIISPLKQINLEKLNFSSFFNSRLSIDSNFVSNRNNEKIKTLEIQIEKDLELNGYKDIQISMNGYFEQEKLLIENVFVDLKNSVLSNKNMNINKYTNIIAIIKNLINIQEDSIIFYE